jgi:hypothetical protein
MRSWRCRIAVPVMLALVALAGCGSDAPVQPTDGNGQVTPPDTSTVRFTRLTFTAYDADGTVETGLTLQWHIEFASTTGRDCKVLRYKLYSGSGETLFEQRNPVPDMIASGETLSGKERWIPIDGPTSAGEYQFRVFYELGRVTSGVDGATHWSGPFATGQIDTTFTAD